jgi:hypothetical protein
VPSILLLLTHIRQAGERAIAYFQKLKLEGSVTFSDLLKEMLDSQDFSITLVHQKTLTKINNIINEITNNCLAV